MVKSCLTTLTDVFVLPPAGLSDQVGHVLTPGLAPHSLGDFIAVELRHADVQQNRMRVEILGDRKRILPL